MLVLDPSISALELPADMMSHVSESSPEAVLDSSEAVLDDSRRGCLRGDGEGRDEGEGGNLDEIGDEG